MKQISHGSTAPAMMLKLLPLLFCSTSALTTAKFQLAQKGKQVTGCILVTLNVGSNIECAAECGKTIGCTGFNIETPAEALKVCELSAYSDDDDVAGVSPANFNFFKKGRYFFITMLSAQP